MRTTLFSLRIKHDARGVVMNSVNIRYDAEGDILFVTFGERQSAKGYQVSNQILLRVKPGTSDPAGLTLFNFTHHVGAAKGIDVGEVGIVAGEAMATDMVKRFVELRKEGGGIKAYLRQPLLLEAVAGI